MTVSSNIDKFNQKPIKIFEMGKEWDTSFACKVETSGHDDEVTVVTRLQEIVSKGISGQLEELIIGEWTEAFENSPSEIITFLIENKAHFAKLKHVFIGDMTYEQCEISWIYQVNYEEFLAAYSELETFGVRGGQGLRFGKFNLPQLKSLRIETGGLSSEAFGDIVNSKSSLKSLESMSIWLGTEDYEGTVEPAQIKALIDGDDMPALSYLGLMNYDQEDEVVAVLKDHPILGRISLLDVSMGVLTDAGGQHMLDNDGLLKLEHINCRHHFMGNDMMAKLKEKFKEQLINLGDQQEDEDDWKYVEVGE